MARSRWTTPPALQKKDASSATEKGETIEEPNGSPFADYFRPTKEEATRAVCLLSALHGFPDRGVHTTMPVLDSLVRTILSQNTTDKTSRKAFETLKSNFPTWQSVMEAKQPAVEEAIRFGGLAEIKARRIQRILQTIISDFSEYCHKAEPSLEFLREKSTEEVKSILHAFNGVGPKTVSCVLMFCLDRPEFPVDTHVWHIAKRLKWAPQSCSRETCYAHLNSRIPSDLKYALHVLLVEHGKCCRKCAKGGRLQHLDSGACPLANWSAKPLLTDSPLKLEDFLEGSGAHTVGAPASKEAALKKGALKAERAKAEEQKVPAPSVKKSAGHTATASRKGRKGGMKRERNKNERRTGAVRSVRAKVEGNK